MPRNMPAFYLHLLKRGMSPWHAIRLVGLVSRVLAEEPAIRKKMEVNRALALWQHFGGGEEPGEFPLTVAVAQLRTEGYRMSMKHARTVAKWYGVRKEKFGGRVFYVVGRDFLDFARKYEEVRERGQVPL